MEEGETREEALRREVAEETGIRKLIAVMESLYYFEFSDPNPNQEYVYGAEVSPTENVILDGKEHSKFKWCTVEEALQLLNWKENKEALKKLDTLLK